MSEINIYKILRLCNHCLKQLKICIDTKTAI
jgi:hypothetical protein